MCIERLVNFVSSRFTLLLRFGIMSAIVTTLNLLPIILSNDIQVNLINQLNRHFHFDHNLFLLDPSIDENDFLNTTSSQTPRSIFVWNKHSAPITEVKSKHTLSIVAPKTSQFDGNVELWAAIKIIHRLQANMKIGIFSNCSCFCGSAIGKKSCASVEHIHF